MQHWHYRDPGNYLAFVRQANASIRAGRLVQLYWSSTPLDARGWSREFRAALNKRINAKAGAAPAGRKDCEDFIASARRDQRRIYDKLVNRVRPSISRFETDEAQRRFGHLIEPLDAY